LNGNFSLVFAEKIPGVFMKKQLINSVFSTGSNMAIRILLTTLLLCYFCSANAKHVRDTVHFKKNIAEKHKLVLTDSALNEIGIDSILNKIEYVHNTLNRINNATNAGFYTREIEENLPQTDSNIDIIDENLSLYTNVLDVKNLQMFDILLTSLQNQLTDWRTVLFKYNKDLEDMSNEMGAFKKDTLLKNILADSAFRSLYLNEINDLKTKWSLAKKSLSDNISRINQLQAAVTNEYFTTIDLQNKSKDLLRKVSIKSLGKEYDYLWLVNAKEQAESTREEQLAKRSYHGQRKILLYYFKRNSSNQLWMLLTGILFSLWIFRNFRKLEKGSGITSTNTTSFSYIKRVSVLATLIVLFNIAPFFDLHPPTAYVAIIELILVITLTMVLWRVWPRHLFYYWLGIGAMYIAFAFTGSILTPDLGFRITLVTLNALSLALGIFWLRAIIKNTMTLSVMTRVVSVIYLVLNAAAILCNLFGRLSLAKIFSVTAIYGLTQVIGLSVFIQIVTEAFELQTLVNKMKGGITAKFNFEKIETLLKNTLIMISIVIWLIIFSISLNMYNFLYSEIIDFLTKERKIGTTTFEIGNILLFISIIYISNLLQRGVGSLYGKSDTTWDPEVKKNGSRLAMTRLVLIVIGFLIAIAASGIPMDKITIVLGALGVGIGLGLQGIVNNLVSGVILIFEQPFRIGDFIELGDKKGRVLDIGIRSSKIVMEEGAEIIMPNANLLSGRVINWTLRNDNVRIDIPVSITTAYTFDEIEKLIIGQLQKSKNVIANVQPEILLLSMNDKTMNINIMVWINDVHRLQPIKSELLNDLYKSFAGMDIKIA